MYLKNSDSNKIEVTSKTKSIFKTCQRLIEGCIKLNNQLGQWSFLLYRITCKVEGRKYII